MLSAGVASVRCDPRRPAHKSFKISHSHTPTLNSRATHIMCDNRHPPFLTRYAPLSIARTLSPPCRIVQQKVFRLRDDPKKLPSERTNLKSKNQHVPPPSVDSPLPLFAACLPAPRSSLLSSPLLSSHLSYMGSLGNRSRSGQQNESSVKSASINLPQKRQALSRSSPLCPAC